MKYLMIIMILGLSLYAGEMDRIEAIVKDIAELREDYNECQKELESRSVVKVDSKEKSKDYKTLLAKERLKNNMLVEKVRKITEEYEKSNKIAKNHLEVKENEELVLKSKYNEDIKIKDNIIKSLENKIKNSSSNTKSKVELCEEENTFPKLIMKNETENSSLETEEKEESFNASPFRLNKDSEIYDSINGNVVYKWEDRTSFTSSVMTQNWIKITGYFINKEWTKATEELWIKKINTIKR